jgi:hypothetical protein
VAVDGKSARGSRTDTRPAAPLLAALTGTGRVLSPLRVPDKTTEVTGFAKLPAPFDLSGCVVTAGAGAVSAASSASVTGSVTKTRFPHAACDHPATKAARAKCRKERLVAVTPTKEKDPGRAAAPAKAAAATPSLETPAEAASTSDSSAARTRACESVSAERESRQQRAPRPIGVGESRGSRLGWLLLVGVRRDALASALCDAQGVGQALGETLGEEQSLVGRRLFPGAEHGAGQFQHFSRRAELIGLDVVGERRQERPAAVRHQVRGFALRTVPGQ